MTSHRKSRGHPSPGIPPCDLNSGKMIEDSRKHAWNLDSIQATIRSDRYIQILLLLTALGLLLRLYNLGFNSIWLDEAVTYNSSKLPFGVLWESIKTGSDFNPPLFYMIESLMLSFGKNEITLRLIPAIAGIITIPVLYYLGKEFSDRNCGIICAALVTFSPFLIFYSQEARAYSLLLLLIALSILCFFKGMKNGRTLQWVLFGLFSGIAFWTHFYSSIVFGVLIGLGLLGTGISKENRLGKIKAIIYSLITFGLVTLPLLIVTAELYLVRTSSPPTFGIQGLNVISHAFTDLSGFNIIPTALFISLFGIGLLWAFLHEKMKGVSIALPVIAILLISYYLSYRMPFQTRFLIIMIPFYFLGIAYSSRAFCQIFRKNIVVYAIIACIFLVNVPILTEYYTVQTKENWRDFANEFEQFTTDGDVVVLLPSYMQQPLDFYYDSTRDHTKELGASNSGDLEKFMEEHAGKRIFVIMTGDILAVEPSGDTVGWLKENATFLGQYTGIYLFQISE